MNDRDPMTDGRIQQPQGGHNSALLMKGDDRMKRQLLTLLIVCALLPLASTAVYAKGSTHVDGTLEYTFAVTV